MPPHFIRARFRRPKKKPPLGRGRQDWAWDGAIQLFIVFVFLLLIEVAVRSLGLGLGFWGVGCCAFSVDRSAGSSLK
jgi:hypothetical protein